MLRQDIVPDPRPTSPFQLASLQRSEFHKRRIAPNSYGIRWLTPASPHEGAAERRASECGGLISVATRKWSLIARNVDLARPPYRPFEGFGFYWSGKTHCEPFLLALCTFAFTSHLSTAQIQRQANNLTWRYDGSQFYQCFRKHRYPLGQMGPLTTKSVIALNNPASRNAVESSWAIDAYGS
ncbi:hypothetical protein GQ43DRAFT_146170 [Delitschia confertaspora ATCC 74209]|uniref:Uncharacterized protein n=1 Tax=Delitschia confertaspora ATCC 74209 TaxID=1513339 RepID=A0A9P4JGK1_9PLEO|nr:hypothetical protein GQ43DRAFT_146170 [Delitschia confertaspora ATCC 74209]